jgi:hypothetical protein
MIAAEITLAFCIAPATVLWLCESRMLQTAGKAIGVLCIAMPCCGKHSVRHNPTGSAVVLPAWRLGL